MASSGAMADFGKVSTGKKLALLFVVLGIFAFVYYRFFYKKVADDLKKAKSALAQSNAKLKEIDENKIPKFKLLRAKKAVLDATIAEQQKALPTEAEVPAFFETLENKVTEAGVEVVRWSKRPEEPVETFVKVPLDIEFVGTFLQIKRFFASLVQKRTPKINATGNEVEERERIVSVEGLTIGTPTIRNREIVLTAKFTAVTFRQEDAKPAAPTQPGQVPTDAPKPAPAGGGASPQPGGNAPPLPSPGTPAGAKANVENSLEKGQQKLENGTTDPADKNRLKGGL